MKMSSSFEKLAEQAKKEPSYWAAGIAMDFAACINRALKRQNISRTELAQRLGTSQAYVTKVLRGDANFTLETMAKISMALDATVHLYLEEKNTHDLISVNIPIPDNHNRAFDTPYSQISFPSAHETIKESSTTAAA